MSFGRLALSQFWFRILGMNECNFFGNGLACLSVILSDRRAHLNNYKPLLLFRWVSVLSWLCTNRSCHVWVCFLQQEMKEKVCLQRGWRKSQQAEDFHDCDLDKTSLWTPVLDSEVTVAVECQCRVLCGWNGWRLVRSSWDTLLHFCCSIFSLLL